MSAITKQWLQQKIADMEEHRDLFPGDLDDDHGKVLSALRVALASLEAEPVVSHIGSKNALDAIVAFIKSNRNPTLKDHNEVSERLFQNNCHGISNHFIEYIKKIGEELEELRSSQDSAPPAPVSVPECFKRLLHHAYGMTMGHDWNKGTMAGHHRAKLCQAVEECRAAMLQGAEPVTTDYKLPEETGSSLQLRNLIRQRHAEWSQATFGDVGPVGPLKHLSKEALEAAEEPEDLSEWADMQFLLWDAQRRAGISDGEITAAMEEKLKVNMARQWPEPKDGEPRLHIKENGNSPVILDGWIACSERMPEEDTYNVVADIGSEGNIYCAAAAWFIHGNFSPMDGVSASNYDGGASIEIDMHISHWMPLPAAPQQEVK